MTQGAQARQAASRYVAWLIALCALVFIGGRIPVIIGQVGFFSTWWNVCGGVAAVGFVMLAIAGMILPSSVVRALWLVLPCLTVTLQLLSYLAYTGPAEGVLPWVWSMEAASVSLLAMIVRLPIVFGLTILSGVSVAVSALVFRGHVPHAVLVSTPLHVSNFAFAVIFVGIRNRMTRFRESELDARIAAEEGARREAGAVRHAAFASLVHDEVLSVLNAALLFRGSAPDILKKEAANALAVLERAPEHGPTRYVRGEEIQASVLARISDLVPTAQFTSRLDDSTVPVHQAEAVLAASAEALRNVVRHAHAAHVWVDLRVEDGAVTIVVRDDGVGFDPTNLDRERLGVSGSIRARMANAGGTSEVRSAPGRGTEVEVRCLP